MSQQAHDHHILPLSTYLTIGTILLILTGVTVWVALHDFGPFNLLVAMAIAGTKALLVALYFMHLKYDHKLYAVVFVGALLFLAVFIVFTMFDTMKRDAIYGSKSRPIEDRAAIYQQADTTTAIAPAAVADSTDAAAEQTPER
jgi:cytochrome c oxidase subunit 4